MESAVLCALCVVAGVSAAWLTLILNSRHKALW